MDKPARTPARGTWHRSGEVWLVGLHGARTPIRDAKGLRHLAHLLERPGEAVSALELVAAAEGHAAPRSAPGTADAGLHATEGGDAGAVLDDQAKAAYRARLEDARAELEEAERFNDPERAERARQEVEFLARELAAAVGLGGRDRRVGAAAERARVNVTRAIKAAVDRIGEHDGPLADHLRAALRTGTFCTYEPPASDPVAWDFGGAAPAPDPPPAAFVVRPARDLLEREAELDAIGAELAAAAAGAGRLVVVDGPAGIGKSALLAAATGAAAEQGFLVLEARAREHEAGFAFGIARQLFDPPLTRMAAATRERLMAGAVAPAAAMLGYADAGPPGHPFAVLNGLHWLTVGLAAQRPLLLVVDDVQWADRESVDWLAYMTSRLDQVPVAVLVGTRPIAPLDDPRGELVEGRRTTVLQLRPLSAAAVGAMVRRTFPEADEAFAEACAAASGGNPFFLGELLASARAGGLAPDAAGAGELRAITPDGVGRLVLSRLRALGEPALALAGACAVLGPADLTTAAAVAGLADEEALAAADGLAAAGILADHHPLDYAHPLVRAAVDRSLSLSTRTRLHERAGELLRARGAPALETANHLRHARPAGDREHAAILRAAAAHTRAHGSAAAAVALLERALAEPPPSEDLPEVLLELAEARAAAGHPAQAVEAAERALPLAGDDARLRARVIDHLCRWEPYDLERRLTLLDDAAARVADLDRDLRFRLEARALQMLHHQSVSRASAALRARHDERLARVAADSLGGTPSERLLLAMDAAQNAVRWTIPYDQVRDTALRALDDGTLVQRLAEGDEACDAAIEALAMADALEAADRHAREAEQRARDRGAVMSEAYACMLRATIAMRRGALLEAEALLPGVLAVSGATADAYMAYVANTMRALIAIERAEFDEALSAWEQLRQAGFTPLAAPAVRGRLYAAQGEPDLAVAELRTAFEHQRAAGRRMGLLVGSIGVDLAIGLAGAGRLDEARALAGEELEAARGFAAPGSVGPALRALGLAERATERLEEAVRVLEPSPARLELARARHALGSARLAAGDAEGAQGELAEAVGLAERCGAARLAEAARAELSAAGASSAPATPVAQARLTPGERRVAELAVRGAGELEIAQALLSTVPAVTAQLRSIRLKLGVSDTGELARALGAA
jgi:tetratricopeptide (TPR) repeat protein